jgi:PAS domain S-box-containing protein
VTPTHTAPAARAGTPGQESDLVVAASRTRGVAAFCKEEHVLLELAAQFLVEGVRACGTAVAIVRPIRLQPLLSRPAVGGERLAAQLVVLDAEELLAGFGADDEGLAEHLEGRVGELVADFLERLDEGQQLYVYNELPAVLWDRGAFTAAIEAEGQWEELQRCHGERLRGSHAIAGFFKSGQIAGERTPDVLPTAPSVEELERRAELESAFAEALMQSRAKLKALRRSEEQLRDFVENGAIGLHRVNAMGTILWANRAELELLGYAKDEYVGRSIADFHADAPIIQDILTRLTRGETLRDYEARLRAKDGSIKHVLINSSVYRRDAEFVHTRCYTRDVTAQVLARGEVDALAAELQKREAEFRTLVESIPQLAWSATPDGSIDWFNRRWYQYTGTSLEDVEGWRWQHLVQPSFRSDVVQRWQAALTEGSSFEMEFPLRRADGAFRWHLTQALPLRDPVGRILRWFGTNTDIDDTKRVEAEREALLESAQREKRNAEAANRTKDEFLITASHELRTPLGAILGWARLLRAGKLDPSGYLRGIETIERNAQVQVRLIEDILDGSRIITGNLRLEIRRLDFTQVVHAALEAVMPAADAKGISVALELDPSASIIAGDPERLQQVVWNLVNNAIKFTPKAGHVSIRLKRVDSDIELEVSDSGQGIAADFLPHVFDRFRQAEGTTTRRHGGLGLGLALVRYLVEAHGGRVSAASPGPGLGATFRAWFPVQAVVVAQEMEPASRESMPSAAPDTSSVDLAGINVLVVDDEADARDLVATVLRGAGAEVTVAASAAEALRLLATSFPMVLVSDVGMPEVDGYDLIRRVRSQFDANGSNLPAVALTAYAREEDRRLALAAGFDRHVAKPVEPAELVRIVARVHAQRPRRARRPG